MANKETAIEKFKRVTGELEAATGCTYDILYPDFDTAIRENRLYVNWFKPFSTIAEVRSETDTIQFKVAGGFEANLIDPDGAVVRTFKENLIPYEADGVTLASDNDYDALVDGTHPSGYTLEIFGENEILLFAEDRCVEPVSAGFSSVAKAILRTQDVVTELLEKAGKAEKIRKELVGGDPLPEENGFDDMIPEPFDSPSIKTEESYDIERRRETAELAAALTSGKKASALKEAAKAVENDTVADEPQAKPAKKAPVKKVAAKKEPAGAKKSSSKAAPKEQSEEAVQPAEAKPSDINGRFDLLPLDKISEFMQIFGAEKNVNKDFLVAIEEFKKTGDGLLPAAAAFGVSVYDDATDAVLALARAAERDAEANGEDAWKVLDAKTFINNAVRCYLLHLRDGGVDPTYAEDALWALLCGSCTESR